MTIILKSLLKILIKGNNLDTCFLKLHIFNPMSSRCLQSKIKGREEIKIFRFLN